MTKLLPKGANTGSSNAATLSAVSNQDLADPWDVSTVTWTELVASTSEDWAGFYLNIGDDSGIQSFNMIALVATGAASSETIVASTFVMQSYYNPTSFDFFPIAIPSGTRISAAVVSNTSHAVDAQIIGVPASPFTSTPSFSRIECGPFDLDNWNTVANNGFFLSLDPGETSNTKSAYTEVSFTGGTNNGNNILNGDSLSAYEYIGFKFKYGSTQNAAADFMVDIARGAASSEVLIAENFYTRGGFGGPSASSIMWVPWGRASGDRISARIQSNVTSASSRYLQMIMYGIVA